MAGKTRLEQIIDPNKPVRAIAPGANISEAAELMAHHEVGCVAVVDDDGHILGTLSERDVVAKVAAPAKDPRMTRVADVMSSDIIICDPDGHAVDAQRIMVEEDVYYLPVARDGKLVGIISRRDILMHQLLATTVIMLQRSKALQDLERLCPGITRLQTQMLGTAAV